MSYDRAGRLAQRTDTGPGSTTVLDLPYTRKLNGQLQTLNRPGDQPAETQTLSYDTLDQLTGATVGSGAGAQTYGYAHDVADRLTRIASPDATTTLEYDAANQLVRTLDTGTGQVRSTFSFDGVGNRRAQDPAGPVAPTTYAYDPAGRLTRYAAPAAVAGGAAVVRDYAYDGDGLRADLLWDSTGDLPLVVGDSAGLYVTGPDGLPLTQLTFDGQQRYYHHDQLGSTRAITNATGTVTARYTFDPYGNPAVGSSAADSRFGYAGQYTDRATGLIYMRARWYDPATGQFITTDPIGLDSGETNLYRYAGGDPANLVDPSGLLSIADVSNFASGVYDELTFGATRKIRELIGSDGVDYCSSAYNAGGYGGMAAGMVGPGGILRGARMTTTAVTGAARSARFVTTSRGTTFDIPKAWVTREAKREGNRISASGGAWQCRFDPDYGAHGAVSERLFPLLQRAWPAADSRGQAWTAECDAP
jgi:RHS repeat-associated protein